MLYEINGPLFFGAAQKAMSALNTARSDGYRVLVIDLGRVPTIDATGLVALENAVSSVLRMKHLVVLAGPLPKPHEIFDKAQLTSKHHGLHVAADLDTALLLAKDLAEESPNKPDPASVRLPARS
jgi:SulP family sulfate permease